MGDGETSNSRAQVAFVTWALFGILEIGNLIEALAFQKWFFGHQASKLTGMLSLGWTSIQEPSG